MKTIWCLVSLYLVLSVGEAWAVSVEIDDGGLVTPIADKTVSGTATLISAANSNRAALNCTNTDASVNVRWGPSTVTAALGQQLKAGLAISIRSTGAVYMISEGVDVTVSCTEEIR